MSVSKQSQSGRSGPRVIGAGLMRTGTNSQMNALQILLGGRCYHMEFIMTKRKSDLKLWYRAATEGLTKELADEIFAGFDASTDYPAAHFYKELMDIYPDAKFVLSVRDPKRWVQSVRSTIGPMYNSVSNMLPPVQWLGGVSSFVPTMRAILGQRLGFWFDMTDEEMMRAFDRHNEAVKRIIPKDRLLVFQVSDGWGPLCEFLNLPVPAEPFPNVNDTEHFQRRTRRIKVAGVVLNVGFCTAVGCVAWFALRRCLERWG